MNIIVVSKLSFIFFPSLTVLSNWANNQLSANIVKSVFMTDLVFLLAQYSYQYFLPYSACSFGLRRWETTMGVNCDSTMSTAQRKFIIQNSILSPKPRLT